MKRFTIQLTAALTFLLGSWALAPFLWAILTSFKSGTELFELRIFPKTLTLANYTGIFSDQPFDLNLLNSLLVALFTVILSTILGVLAAYPLSRACFRGRRTILLSFLFVSMFPQVAILSGLFELIRSLGLFNHKAALILSYSVFTLPFTAWTLTVFMRELPKSVEEAALLDGAGSFTMIFRILLPMMVPAIVTTSLLAFIAAWNEFLFALTFTVTDAARTVPVAIAMMSGASEHEVPWAKIMAASVLVTIPIIVMVLLFQKRIVSGLTAGSVKG